MIQSIHVCATPDAGGYSVYVNKLISVDAPDFDGAYQTAVDIANKAGFAVEHFNEDTGELLLCPINRFLLFSGDHYYPGGGAEDYQRGFRSFEDAVVAASTMPGGSYHWWHIFDTAQAKIVLKSS